MIGVQSSLYTVAIALCVFSAGILRDRQGRAGWLPIWFMVFLGIETLAFVFELLMVHPATPLKALWLGLRMATSLLVAPCLWLAVKEGAEDVRLRLSTLGRGHWTVIVAGFVLLLPLISSAHLGLGYPNPENPASPLQARVIHATMLLCIGIFAVQVPYYLWQCRRLLKNKDATLKWLQLPLVVVLTTWILGLLRTVHCAAHTPQELSLLFAVADVGVTVGAMYAIIRRCSSPGRDPAARRQETIDLSGPDPVAQTAVLMVAAVSPQPCGPTEPVPVLVMPEPCKPVVSPESPVSPTRVETTTPEVKYARSSLDAATRERIRRKLTQALVLEKTYQDSLLNLRSLSRAINEKAHYVSQVVNQDLGSSFYELVNRHRIERAKQLLVDTPDQTVLEIALAVGFNSKSTFNTAFRRCTAMTPTDYRAATLASQQQSNN